MLWGRARLVLRSLCCRPQISPTGLARARRVCGPLSHPADQQRSCQGESDAFLRDNIHETSGPYLYTWKETKKH